MDMFKIILIIILFAIILFQFVQLNRTKEINDKLKEIVANSNEQYQDVVQVNKSLRNIRHDINKQKAMVKALKVDEVIEELTGLEIIDRIIHFKGNEIRSNNIRFSVKAMKLQAMDISNGAIISIFTNIFDNAIEACQGLENPWISCEILKNEDNRFQMVVENSKTRDIVVDSDNIVTTKEDKELHGYGLGIISDLIRKNNGTISLEDKGTSFCLSIQL